MRGAAVSQYGIAQEEQVARRSRQKIITIASGFTFTSLPPPTLLEGRNYAAGGLKDIGRGYSYRLGVIYNHWQRIFTQLVDIVKEIDRKL